MTVDQIKNAVDNGFNVFWSNRGYQVRKDVKGRYFIVRGLSGDAVELTDASGTKLNGDSREFYVA